MLFPWQSRIPIYTMLCFPPALPMGTSPQNTKSNLFSWSNLSREASKGDGLPGLTRSLCKDQCRRATRWTVNLSVSSAHPSSQCTRALFNFPVKRQEIWLSKPHRETRVLTLSIGEKDSFLRSLSIPLDMMETLRNSGDENFVKSWQDRNGCEIWFFFQWTGVFSWLTSVGRYASTWIGGKRLC